MLWSQTQQKAALQKLNMNHRSSPVWMNERFCISSFFEKKSRKVLQNCFQVCLKIFFDTIWSEFDRKKKCISLITDFRTSIRHIFTDIVWLTTANLLFLRVLPDVPSAADGCMSAVWHPLYLGHSYIYAFACLECLQWIQDALSSASWKKTKKTKHNILPFLLLDSPSKNANILKLFF